MKSSSAIAQRLDLLWFVRIKPLHAQMADHELSVFGDLHIVDFEVNYMFWRFLCIASCERKYCKSFDPYFVCVSKALTMFGELPLPERAIRMSPLSALRFKLVRIDIFVAGVIGKTSNDASYLMAELLCVVRAALRLGRKRRCRNEDHWRCESHSLHCLHCRR